MLRVDREVEDVTDGLVVRELTWADGTTEVRHVRCAVRAADAVAVDVGERLAGGDTEDGAALGAPSGGIEVEQGPAILQQEHRPVVGRAP